MNADYGAQLETLTRLRGIRGALVVDRQDGLVVAEALMSGVKGTALAAMAANLAASIGELSSKAGFGTPRFLHLQAADGSLLVAPAGPDVILVAVVGRDVPLGLLRLEMLRMAERLA